MTTRRDFLRRTSLALTGGLIVGDAALEAFERLTHRRTMFPSADVGPFGRPLLENTLDAQMFHNGVEYEYSYSLIRRDHRGWWRSTNRVAFSRFGASA